MVNIGIWCAYNELNVDNFIFSNNNVEIGDDLLLPFVSLMEHGRKVDINFEVVNGDMRKYDAFIFFDIPKKNSEMHNEILCSGKKVFLLLLESKHVLPKGHNKKNHSVFAKVFTWDDELVDNKKYLKINYAFNLNKLSINTNIVSRKKNLVLISGNKKSSDKFELYSERKKVINYFELNDNTFLDLYGVHWNKRAFSSKLMNFISLKLDFLKTILYSPPKCYLGSVERKREVISKYKFCICFENRCGDKGYVTEKIFDSMLAGTIPVYFGAENVADHIPSNCFIDYRKYNSVQELHFALNNMTDFELNEYVYNIVKFINSKQAEQFDINFFIEQITNGIVSELNESI